MKKTSVALLIFILLFAATIFCVTQNGGSAAGEFSAPSEKWVSAAEGSEDTIQSVTADNGYVYVEAGGIYGNLLLYCIDAANGNQVWNYTIYSFHFTVLNDRVYVAGNSHYATDPVLLCLNASTGAELWKKDLNGKVGEITLAGDYLYVASGNAVNVFQVGTGEQKWTYSAAADQSFVSLIVSDGYVCTVSTSNVDVYPFTSYGYVLNASVDQELWSQKIWFQSPPEGYTAKLKVTNDVLFISQTTRSPNSVGSGSILSFDIQNGTLLWKHQTNGKVSDFTVADGTVFCSMVSGDVFAVKASDDSLIWDQKGDLQPGSIIAAKGYLYVSSIKGITCYDGSNGATIWGYQASDYNSNPTHGNMVDDLLPVQPTYSNGVIYFGWNGPQGWLDTTDHNFYALNAYTGEVLWEKTLSYRFQTAPVIADDTLYLCGSAITTKSPTWLDAGAVIVFELQAENSSRLNASAITVLLACVLVAAAFAVVLIVQKKRKKVVKS